MNFVITKNLTCEDQGELEMQKLPGVGKFFNEWQADLPPPFQKRKYNTEKGILAQKHKKALLNLRKDIFSRELWMANLSIH